MIFNLILIIIISGLALFRFYFIGKRDSSVPAELNVDPYRIPYLVNEVKNTFEGILNKNIADLNLNKAETMKRAKIKSLIRKNLRSCSYGDVGAKEYVKDYIKEILLKDLDIKEGNIDRIIPFTNRNLLTLQDKFEILLYIFKKQYEYDALSMLINMYHLADLKKDGDEGHYEITKEEIEEIYDLECQNLLFTDKLEVLTQRIYQLYKGFGVIDEIRDMKIDGVSGGISGIPFDFYTYQADNFNAMDGKNLNAYNSIWIFYQGKTTHLSFLGFGSQHELIRVCRNIYRYGNPGQLSEARGFIANDMKDGSRVVTFRPPFSDRWAFFVRKHDSILDMDINNIIKDEGRETLIEILKWMVRGCLVIVITGEMGSGKTTLLKLMIQYIRRSFTLRIHEQIFELNLSRVYPKLNILTLRETDTISGQDTLDIMKKTDGTVIILGEVASHTAANWLVETAQISKMTMCSHHAQTTEDLVDHLKISQLRVGGFHNEFLAEEQVVKAVNIDIHMENQNGHRYISRITEIIPITDKEYPSDLRPAALEFFKRNTDRRAYITKDIIRFENGKYVLKNNFSSRANDRILRNLDDLEQEEYLRLFQPGEQEGMVYE
ncbi:pilus assembly protein CpaF [Anaerocolumna sedimenticola]|uniref:Pilus assembly protein CpaF n=1 Tax=Anaerocolumna sedimenticola TaxID=2696063 RepID=A0A6P1TT27_9FIRM|nr:ATPase, T2SS/T4P/T4SS family [Anaerocolumna sedimenticola]QHQ62876.1 pilus assembly protein CpaF [Anaerocolumna sedimenticola]